MEHRTSQLTIVSVYHSDLTRRILEANADFIAAMNPGDSWVHLAVNNSPAQSIHTRHPRLRETAGAPIPAFAPKSGFVGYHEGGGLNLGLKEVSTRFALFLDHDFFVVRPRWIAEVLAHLTKQGLAILTAPYHPKYWVKVRYFPGAYCIFADREKVGEEFFSWDFMPQHTPAELAREQVSAVRKAAWRAAHPHPSSWLRQFAESMKKRRYVGTGRDVSYDLYRRYRARPEITIECLPATVTLHDFLTHYRLSPRWYPLLYRLERLIPERWSFIPKRKGYFTFTRFCDLGYADVLGTGMEEWWWRGAPFAFHVRGFKERRTKEIGRSFDPEDNMRIIRDMVSAFQANAEGAGAAGGGARGDLTPRGSAA